MRKGSHDIKVLRYLILFVFGIILTLNGIFSILFEKAFPGKVSDEYVITRAKELGYIEAKEALIQNIETTQKIKDKKEKEQAKKKIKKEKVKDKKKKT